MSVFYEGVKVSHGREREKRTVLGSGKMTHALKNLGAICHDSHGLMGIHKIHYSRIEGLTGHRLDKVLN